MNIKRWVPGPTMWIIALVAFALLAPYIGMFTTNYGRKCRELGGHLDLDWRCYRITTEVLQVQP